MAGSRVCRIITWEDKVHLFNKCSVCKRYTEAYFFYEQYKQIKFVFDKRQHHICNELEKAGFPIPVPKVLYVDLLLTNQLNTVLDSLRGSLRGNTGQAA